MTLTVKDVVGFSIYSDVQKEASELENRKWLSVLDYAYAYNKVASYTESFEVGIWIAGSSNRRRG
jgi:hypothetical protein